MKNTGKGLKILLLIIAGCLMILGIGIIQKGCEFDLEYTDEVTLKRFKQDLVDAIEIKFLDDYSCLISSEDIRNENYPRQIIFEDNQEIIDFDSKFNYTWETQFNNQIAIQNVNNGVVSAFGNGPVWHHHNTWAFVSLVNRCDAGDIVLIGGKKYEVVSRVKFINYDDDQLYTALYTHATPGIITCWDWDALGLVNQGRRFVELKEIS